jgi:lysophospholipase L1-like esterase
MLAMTAAFLPLRSQQTAESGLPRVIVVGDSTASNSAEGMQGWGDPFSSYFDSTKIQVLNRARAGRSSRTFQSEGLWSRVISELKPGDFVLIQFGHNDAGALDTGRARGSLPGTGDETRTVTTLSGNQELVHTYGWYLRKYIQDTKARGATAIVLSLTVRNIWKDGKVERGSGNFGKWAAEIAQSEGAPFVDVTSIIADRYEKLGQETAGRFFPGDHTHTNPAGADFNARAVIAGLKALRDSLLPAYLSPKGAEVEPYGALAMRTSATIALPEPLRPELPSLFLIGDSTVRNGRGDGANGQWGWGDRISQFFDEGRINVVNRAVGGLSSRTYLTKGYWDQVLNLLKPGDFVMMQFGHNDSGPLDDASRARGTLTGTGEEIREIENPIKRQHEVVHTYGWYLRQYIAGARAKGATVMVCSLVPRKIWKDGRIARNPESYAKWAADVAKSEAVAFLDLHENIAVLYDKLGPDKVDPLFADEHTHTSLAGADLNAGCVIRALQGLNENPLAPYLRKPTRR